MDIEIVLGGTGNDTMTGNGLDTTLRTYTVSIMSGTTTVSTSTVPDLKNAAANTLNGGAGDDTFYELASSSTNIYIGGAGNNLIDYSSRSGTPLTITLDGKATSGETGENDTIGADFRDATGGSFNVNTITGNALANVLRGGPGSTSTIHGKEGDDTIYMVGNDTLFGDAGDDTFVLATSTGMGGNVSIDCGAGTANTVDLSFSVSSTTIDLAFGSTSTTDGFGFHITLAGTADTCNNAVGGQGTNLLFGNSLDNILDGNSSSTGATIDGRGGVNMCMNFTSGSGTSCQ
jgi:Ca2+-binding RTX toxin-like protein